MKRYISDYHIGHQNAMNFDSRPFVTLDEMHEIIIRNWNSVVGNGDDVFILGDFAPGNCFSISSISSRYGFSDIVSTSPLSAIIFLKTVPAAKAAGTAFVLRFSLKPAAYSARLSAVIFA